MDKSTTKVRVVFDCAAECDGISLNYMIHVGPKLQQYLFNVLVCLRRNPFGVACDIKEIYLQIEIEERQICFGEIVILTDSQTYSSLAVERIPPPWSRSLLRRRTLEETKTAIPLPLRLSLSQPIWTILLTVLKTMMKEWRCTVNWKHYGELQAYKPGSGSLIHRKLLKRARHRDRD